MTAKRDPFELLPNFTDPEPDPVVMHAVIAQSREAFANRSPPRDREPRSLTRWFQQSANWLMPVGAGIAALVIALIVSPGLLKTSSSPVPDRDVVAELPAANSPTQPSLSRGQDTPPAAPSAGPRLGMQPPPGVVPSPTETLPQTVLRFQGDGVVIGTRLDATGMEIFLPEISGEETIDVQGIMPGETLEILGAFAQPDQNLIAVQFRVDDVRFWRIYGLVDGQYDRDPERSQLVSDAADRAEVEQRLSTE